MTSLVVLHFGNLHEKDPEVGLLHVEDPQVPKYYHQLNNRNHEYIYANILVFRRVFMSNVQCKYCIRKSLIIMS